MDASLAAVGLPTKEIAMRKIRWGVLSTAKIAREKVIPATQASETGVVTAIASRDRTHAAEIASRLGIEKAFGSYEELLADPDVDAVYIPLPNHLHVPWSLRAIAAGKHVLCEKPIGLSVDEAQQLADAAAAHPRLIVMEAFMYRFHPQWQTARRLVREGRIGELRTIHTSFSYFNDDPRNIRNKLEMGGGADGYWLLPDFTLAIYLRCRTGARVGAPRTRSGNARRSVDVGPAGIPARHFHLHMRNRSRRTSASICGARRGESRSRYRSTHRRICRAVYGYNRTTKPMT